jgi:hypothetical protein
LNVPVDDIIN